MQFKQVYCITLNSFPLIPVTRFIIDFFSNHFDTRVVQCAIQNQKELFNVAGTTIIGTFKSSKELNRQSVVFKIWKYIVIGYVFCTVIFKRGPILIYTPDYQILRIALRIKTSFNLAKWKLIYHQFELVEDKLLNAKDKSCWLQVISNIDLVALCIFPEINRQTYFLNLIPGYHHPNTLLFPNTCPSQKGIESIRHPLFGSIGESSTVFGHIGNVGPDHYFKEFLDIIEKCMIFKNVFFVVAGRYSEEVMEQFNTVKNENLIFLGELPHHQLQTIYPFIDFGFILYKAVDLNFEFCAPNKLYEYWSHGIPVIAHPLQGLIPLFDNPLKGILLDFQSPDLTSEITNVITQGKPDKKALKQIFDQSLDISAYLTKLRKSINAI